MRHRGKSKIIIGVIIAVAAIVAFALVMHGIESVQNRRGDGDSSDTDTITINLNGTKYVTDHHLKNYLIIGTDHSNTKKNSEEGYHGGMADFLLLVVLDVPDQT